jgi:hypothetical protein
LNGALSLIKPIVESHRPRLAKAMADHSKAMLAIVRDIRERMESIRKFDVPTSYNTTTTAGQATATVPDNMDDGDNQSDDAPQQPAPTNAGNAVQPNVMTTYIPISLRAKMPLQPSKMIANDSRLSTEYARVTTTLEAANQVHLTYLTEMSKFARRIAETELAARITLLEHAYNDALDTISQGLIIVQIHLEGNTAENFNETDLAAIAAAFLHPRLPSNHWGSLPFINPTRTKEVYSDEKQQKLSEGQKTIATMINSDNTRGASVLCLRVVEELTKIIPALTTDLWTHDYKLDQAKALDAKLRAVTSKKSIDKANTRLNDALNNNAGELVRPIVNQEVRQELNKALSRKKKSTRKNYSAEDKTQSLQAGSGRRNSKNSGERKKRSERDSSTSSSSRSGTRRGRSRPRKSTQQAPKDYDDNRSQRSESTKPPGILRLKTSKFRPGRGSISDDDSDDLRVYADHHPAKHRNASRNQSRDGRNRGRQDGAKSANRGRGSTRN